MSKILYVWELGGNMGHLARFHPMAIELLERGHEVCFAAKEVYLLHRFDWPKEVRMFQTPVWPPSKKEMRSSHCYSEIIENRGFSSKENLLFLSAAWLGLFELIDPDIIVFDHAPAALFTSRQLNIPRIICDNAILIPPKGHGSQTTMSQYDDMERLDSSDTRVLKRINEALGALKLKKLDYIYDLLDADQIMIYGYPELDMYAKWRGDVTYLGASKSVGKFSSMKWPSETKPKIFAYLKYGSDQTDNILRYLKQNELNVLCFCSGAPNEYLQEHNCEYITMSPHALNIKSSFTEADTVICHAGGIVYEALKFGCALILLPNQLEQFSRANLLELKGLGVNIQKSNNFDQMKNKLAHFFSDSELSARVKAYQQKIACAFVLDPHIAICNAIDDVLHKG